MSLLEQMKMSPAQATEMFIKLRDTKKAKDAEHKKSLKKLVAAMEKLEGALLEFLDANGVQNVACAPAPHTSDRLSPPSRTRTRSASSSSIRNNGRLVTCYGCVRFTFASQLVVHVY